MVYGVCVCVCVCLFLFLFISVQCLLLVYHSICLFTVYCLSFYLLVYCCFPDLLSTSPAAQALVSLKDEFYKLYISYGYDIQCYVHNYEHR